MVDTVKAFLELFAEYSVTGVVLAISCLGIIKVFNVFMKTLVDKIDDLVDKISAVSTKVDDRCDRLQDGCRDIDRRLNNVLRENTEISRDALDHIDALKSSIDVSLYSSDSVKSTVLQTSALQTQVLRDIQRHCPAVMSRDLIINELIRRNMVTREQVMEVIRFYEDPTQNRK